MSRLEEVQSQKAISGVWKLQLTGYWLFEIVGCCLIAAPRLPHNDTPIVACRNKNDAGETGSLTQMNDT